MALAQQRLLEERKLFRKDRPFGFSAKPRNKPDGSTDMYTWDCIVPGKDGTYMEGGKFPCTIKFRSDYPNKPPAVYMPQGFLHVNVFDNGAVCLSILKTEIPEHLAAMATVDAWKPSISIKQILLSIQELLHNPNFGSVANWEAHKLNAKSAGAYAAKMREQARQYAHTGEDD
mmetsp:Transcript_12077/g.29453  ORF Transcript_12077/g.29453 Transcript_12077/m.29453 type:complete len:173 (-) Transcript_12077:60-578(-)